MSETIHGLNPVRELLRSDPNRVAELLLAQGSGQGRLKEILGLARAGGVKVRKRPRAELTKLAGTEGHQGVLALVGSFAYIDLEDLLAVPGIDLVLLLDGLNDPHNLGAIGRSALAAGAAGLIIPKDRSVKVTPAAIKASAGALNHLPVARVTNLNRTAERLKEAGFWLLGTLPRAATGLYELGPLPEKLALVIGSEGKGISRALSKKCDLAAHLPLTGPVESLNASAATAVFLFEIVRQRQRG